LLLFCILPLTWIVGGGEVGKEKGDDAGGNKGAEGRSGSKEYKESSAPADGDGPSAAEGRSGSKEYKEGYDSGLHFGRELRQARAIQGEVLFRKSDITELLDVESQEAETGFIAIPYPAGSKRADWVKGYKDGLSKGYLH
jgi:hypothetical protein